MKYFWEQRDLITISEIKIEGNVLNKIQNSQELRDIILKKDSVYCLTSQKNYKEKLFTKKSKESQKII